MNKVRKVLLSLSTLTLAASCQATLVAYWNYNEGSGNVLYNTYGSDANDGVITGATYTSGRPGAGDALDFSGSGGNYVLVAEDNFAFGKSDFTISTWFNASEIDPEDNTHKFMFSTYDGAGGFTNTGYTLSLVRGGLSTTGRAEFKVFGDASGPATVISNNALDDGSWHNVVGVVSNGNLSLYIDGVLQTSTDSYATDTIANPSQNLTIGRQRESSTLHNFDGLLDDTAVFDIALDQSQITTLYTQGPLSVVPEPAESALIGGIGLAILLMLRRRKA